MNAVNTSGQLGSIPADVSMADMANPPRTIRALRAREGELETAIRDLLVAHTMEATTSRQELEENVASHNLWAAAEARARSLLPNF